MANGDVRCMWRDVLDAFLGKCLALVSQSLGIIFFNIKILSIILNNRSFAPFCHALHVSLASQGGSRSPLHGITHPIMC